MIQYRHESPVGYSREHIQSSTKYEWGFEQTKYKRVGILIHNN